MTNPTDHGLDNLGGNEEPDGGWVTAPTLADSQILTIALCRFTGQRPVEDQVNGAPMCPKRALSLHEDTDCITLYHQEDALRSGLIHYELPATEVTVAGGGDEPTYQHPVA